MFKHSFFAALALTASVESAAAALRLAPPFKSHNDEFVAGALWWIGNLSTPAPMPCEALSGDAFAGCVATKVMLAWKE
jgi:hypothetical protein